MSPRVRIFARRASSAARFLATLALLAVATRLDAQLSAEQIAQLKLVTSAAVSPDGRQVAFTRALPRTAAEDTMPGLRAMSELFIVPVAGGEPRAVVQAPLSASAPQWSPDGSQLGFLHRGQVYAVPAAGGEPRALTNVASGVMLFRWSPDGRTLAVVSRVPEPADVQARRRRGDDVMVSDGAYLPWIFPLQEPRPSRVWLVPIGGGDARAITPADKFVHDVAWAPDGRRLAVTIADRGDADATEMDKRIDLVTVDGAMQPLVPRVGKLGPLAWSPDGARVAWLQATRANDPIAQTVFVAAPGEAPRALTAGFEGTVVWLDWQDARTVRFIAVESTRTSLNTVPAAGGAITRVLGLGTEIFQAMTVARDGNVVAMVANTSTHPNEVYVGTLRDRSLRRVTTSNPWLAEVRLGRQETVSWMARDGQRVDGVLVHPVDAAPGTRAPLAVLPHGGPEGIDLDGWNSRSLYPVQLLAGAGYAVFMPNYRGSGGRGVVWSMADHRDLGGREFDDVLDGIDYLHERGFADRNRVGISGTSYGGYFSAWAGTKHSSRFRLAMPFAGISNWMSFTGTTDIPREMSVVHWDLWPYDHPLLMWERSPVAHLATANTPMIIGQGLVDERVHPEQMIQLHQALRLKGVPSEFVAYPREPHGLLERQHQIDYMNRIKQAFDTYVKPQAPVRWQP
jgi:dipeptidyl aminopeptidase/acylaminoacyl peptidase